MTYFTGNILKTLSIAFTSRILALLLIAIFVNFSGELLTVSSAKELEQIKISKEMNMMDKKEIPPSVWGGNGIILTVGKVGVNIEFGCAQAITGEKLLIDEDGNFSFEGTYTISSGASIIGSQPENQPAMFVGNILDKQMTLKITHTENKEEIGNYTLERDKEARLFRCL